jgi:DNA invertase Pin-like site-specific DNA recombinase
MAKAYSYIRFSSAKQLKGDSIARQTKLSESYAAKHDLELDTNLSMRDLGVSAYDRSNLTKGALGEFLRQIEQGNIPVGSYLLVESLDRLSRDKVMDALNIFSGILKAGIIIVTLADEQVYSYDKANENFTSLIMSIVIMSRANEESMMKSLRIRSSWDAKRKNVTQKRLTSRCPNWLRPSDGENGFEPIPERAAVVLRIFQMARDGVGNSTIVKVLNAEGVPTFSTKSDGWQTSYIQKILSNRAVYGEFQPTLTREGEVKAVDFANVIGADSSAEQKLNAAVLQLERIKLEIENVNGRNQSLLTALEQSEGSPPQVVLSRIKENEARLANLEETKGQAEDAVLLLASSRVDASEQQNLIVTLLDQLESLEGEDLHLLRVRLSVAIKKVVKLITTYPGGRFYTDEEVEIYRRDLIASDEYGHESITAQCEMLDTKPNKSNRLLMMEFHNGEHRTVLASGKVLDRELPPPAEWDINTLFESLAFSVFKRVGND